MRTVHIQNHQRLVVHDLVLNGILLHGTEVDVDIFKRSFLLKLKKKTHNFIDRGTLDQHKQSLETSPMLQSHVLADVYICKVYMALYL